MEFINSKRNNRKRLVYICLFFLSCEIALFLIQYKTKPFSTERWIASIGRPNDYYYLKNTLTFNELMFWLIVLTTGFLGYAIYSKIIRRVDIDIDNDRFFIEYIDRFQINPKTQNVKASSIQTQLDDFDNSNTFFHDSDPDFLGENYKRLQNLYLTHKDFGTIMLSTRDFDEERMQLIVKLFAHIKREKAAKIRQRRK